MEIARASGAAIHVRKFAGEAWDFPLLSVEDIGELQREVPTPSSRVFATIFEIAQWAKTADGPQSILWRSMRKMPGKSGITRADVLQYGSVSQRSSLASAIILESLVSGEEEEDGEAVNGQKKT